MPWLNASGRLAENPAASADPATKPSSTPLSTPAILRAMRPSYVDRLLTVSKDCSENGEIDDLLSELPTHELAAIAHDWAFAAREDQLPPEPDDPDQPWRVWVILGGRGAGKTRAGAEWVRALALGIEPYAGEPAQRIALIGETLNDVRRVMIEGISGLLSVHGDGERPHFEASKLQLTWPNGTVAQMFSAENPDSLRGPQFSAAWCDELAKWRQPETTWDMLQFGLRLGANPQVAVTTTPRPIPLLKKLLADGATVLTRASTQDNARNLSPGFIAEMKRRYDGTALGRQELMGEIVDDVAGSLWRREWIAERRVISAPDLTHIVVAVDPPVTATADSDACGIVVAGVAANGHGYVLADRTVQGREPHAWARAVIAAYQEFMADRVVAEVNQGGDLVVTVLRQIDAAVSVRKVHATRGKWLRAEPIAALYAAVTVPGRSAGPGTAIATGPPEYTFLDLPLLRGDEPPGQGYVAVAKEPWPGSVAIYGSPALSGFALKGIAAFPSVMGETLDPMPPGRVAVFDRTTRVRVEIGAGELSSATAMMLFGGANMAAVQNGEGEWEMFQFQDATLVAQRTYELSTLLRGQAGTEGAMTETLPIGTRVVFLSEALAPVELSMAEFRLPLNWRVGPASLDLGHESYSAGTHTFRGTGMRPLSPVHVRASRSGGNLTLSWIRRTRFGGDNWEAAEVPLGEEMQRYEIDILDGTDVMRTIVSDTPSAIYTATQQTSDFGAPQASVSVAIYQMSAAYGRGAPARATC